MYMLGLQVTSKENRSSIICKLPHQAGIMDKRCSIPGFLGVPQNRVDESLSSSMTKMMLKKK